MKELTLEITNKCYQQCPWCSSDSSPKGFLTPRERILEILDSCRPECDVVRFSGGEPTLHPGLPDFLFYAKRLEYQVVLLTNGLEMNRALEGVDEYWINLVNEKSLLEALVLKHMGRFVGLHVVLAKGNEEWIRRGLNTSFLYSIPVRLLVLQKQGRGANCKPLDLISWTGDKGCNLENKITITPTGKVVTCSALKYGKCSLKEEE